MITRGLATLIAASLLSVAGIAAAAAEDLVFTLDNETSADLTEFYTSPVNVNDWESDVLGADVLPAGSAIEITIADGRTQCNYDMKFVFTDGTTLEKDGVDLCNLDTYTLTDN